MLKPLPDTYRIENMRLNQLNTYFISQRVPDLLDMSILTSSEMMLHTMQHSTFDFENAVPPVLNLYVPFS